MVWNDLDMELERKQRDFDRRVEEGCRELRSRFEKLEQRCQEAEEARRSEWEAAEGRVMTASEELQHRHDGFMRLLSAVTDHYVKVIDALGADMRAEFAKGRTEAEEGRAQLRANTEAVMRMLDRLPPPESN
jgi:hypothetical protein